MQEKFLSTISPRVLAKKFNHNGHDVIYRDYLVREVFPYIDLSKDVILLKSGLEITLKDFIEESVLYTCQNRYRGNFVEFAKDNIVAARVSKNEEKSLEVKEASSADKKTYVFYEECTGPKYLVVVDSGNVEFVYKDSKFEVTMTDEQDRKDFLKRIKKLDADLFEDIYKNNVTFGDYVKQFSNDKVFFNSLMIGIENKNPFDKEIDEQIESITGIIDLVESGKVFEVPDINNPAAETNPVKEKVEEVKQTFEIDSFPLFDTDKCLRIVLNKCESFYHEFVRNVSATFEENSILEKAEYIIDEYLGKTINHGFYEYISGVASAVNEDLELDINEDFISRGLEDIINNLRSALRKLFVNPYDKNDKDVAEVYINIIVEAIRKEIVEYENKVNIAVESKLNDFGYVFKNNEEVPHM